MPEMQKAEVREG